MDVPLLDLFPTILSCLFSLLSLRATTLGNNPSKNRNNTQSAKKLSHLAVLGIEPLLQESAFVFMVICGGSSFEEDSFHIQIEADLCEDLKPETTTPRATITPHHL